MGRAGFRKDGGVLEIRECVCFETSHYLCDFCVIFMLLRDTVAECFIWHSSYCHMKIFKSKFNCARIKTWYLLSVALQYQLYKKVSLA